MRLWCRPAAVAMIQPLAWELPYATGAALKNEKQSKNKEKRGVPTVVQQVTNPTVILEDVGSIPGLAQWVKDLVLP